MKSGALDRLANDYKFTLRSGLMRQLHEIFVMEIHQALMKLIKFSKLSNSEETLMVLLKTLLLSDVSFKTTYKK